jgi:DNA-binding response OmpR family regulator
VKGRILFVEDEELVGTMVRMNLEGEGYDVTWCRDGESGLARLDRRFDLVVLDIALPGIDGIEVLTRLRGQGIGTPVLMLTARSDVSIKVKTLDLGADDYLAKPFDVAELLARVKAMVRRSQAEREIPSHDLVRIGPHEINLRTRQAMTNEGPLTLSEREAALIAMLVSAQSRVLSRADILEEAWGMDVSPGERTVDNFILRLRKLFEPDPHNPRHFISIRGAGYRFEL